MRSRQWSVLLAAAAVVVIVIVVPVFAQAPTQQNPLRFSAFAVQMQGGIAGTVDIAIERWSTEAERQALIALVQTAKVGRQGQDKLLKGLQDIEPRTGFIRTSRSLGWDLKYAHQNRLPDGSRQIVIATDKPVTFVGVAAQARTLDYPFTLIEMRFPAGSDKGEGKALVQTSISVKDGQLQLEIYGQEPTRLTTITERK